MDPFWRPVYLLFILMMLSVVFVVISAVFLLYYMLSQFTFLKPKLAKITILLRFKVNQCHQC